MEWIADPTAWLGLGTLILLEIVLGIDNLIFIGVRQVVVDKQPPSKTLGRFDRRTHIDPLIACPIARR